MSTPEVIIFRKSDSDSSVYIGVHDETYFEKEVRLYDLNVTNQVDDLRLRVEHIRDEFLERVKLRHDRIALAINDTYSTSVDGQCIPFRIIELSEHQAVCSYMWEGQDFVSKTGLCPTALLNALCEKGLSSSGLTILTQSIHYDIRKRETRITAPQRAIEDYMRSVPCRDAVTSSMIGTAALKTLPFFVIDAFI